MIQNTTTASYDKNIRPKKASLEAQIRFLLQDYPEGLTNREIAHYLSHPFPSTISGIVRPMVAKLGQLYEGGERTCSVSGNVSKIWKLTHPPKPKPAEPQTLFTLETKVANINQPTN